MEEEAPPASKKAKQGGSALSSLLRKVENTNITVATSTMTAVEGDRLKQEWASKLNERLADSSVKSGLLKENNGEL